MHGDVKAHAKLCEKADTPKLNCRLSTPQALCAGLSAENETRHHTTASPQVTMVPRP